MATIVKNPTLYLTSACLCLISAVVAGLFYGGYMNGECSSVNTTCKNVTLPLSITATVTSFFCCSLALVFMMNSRGSYSYD